MEIHDSIKDLVRIAIALGAVALFVCLVWGAGFLLEKVGDRVFRNANEWDRRSEWGRKKKR